MSVLFLDTSALAKIYVYEEGSDPIRRRSGAAEVVASSLLAWPECLAMLARRKREGLLSEGERAALHAQFTEDFADLLVVDLDARVLEIVERLVSNHPLRGADAVHLASALLLVEAGLSVEFACCDRALLAAARAERLPAFDPGAAVAGRPD